MRDIIDPVLVYKLLGDDPWRVGHDFVDPSAMPRRLAPFDVGHDRRRFMLRDEQVGADAHDQVHSRERKFCLAELQRMSAHTYKPNRSTQDGPARTRNETNHTPHRHKSEQAGLSEGDWYGTYAQEQPR